LKCATNCSSSNFIRADAPQYPACSPESNGVTIYALDDQVSYSMGKRICFASPGSRDDEQRLIAAVLRSLALFGIERVEIWLGHCPRPEPDGQLQD
jgi:hypothetical protein